MYFTDFPEKYTREQFSKQRIIEYEFNASGKPSIFTFNFKLAGMCLKDTTYNKYQIAYKFCVSKQPIFTGYGNSSGKFH